jgi:hypothetical protein
LFREFKAKKIERFKEFDEARKFIENFGKNSFDAIDYMIDHKEYYFLLKNVLKQLPDNEIVEYVFYNLPCLRREEDMEIFLALFDKYPVVRDYVKACKSIEFLRLLYKKDKKKAKELLEEMFLDEDLIREIERSLDEY